jgi:hypothetical protein
MLRRGSLGSASLQRRFPPSPAQATCGRSRRLANLQAQVITSNQHAVADFSHDTKRLACDPAGIVCVIPDPSPTVVCDPVTDICVELEPSPVLEPSPLEYWVPRLTILGCCALYGTNFVYGKLLGASLDPSAVCGLRFSLAALALSPYLRRLDSALLVPALSCGLATSIGYIGQARYCR